MEFYPMSKILFMVLIVALWLWAFCSMVISIFKPKKEYQKEIKELEKKLKAIGRWKLEPKVGQKAISDVNYDRAKKDKWGRDLTTWESLRKNN
tara:strand:- start:96 stop:374 length:279 start_codon:yes stop_codon:yes gene_type:complete